MATGLYNNKPMVNAIDNCGKIFKILDAWKKLRVHPKYMPEISGNGSPSNDSSPDVGIGATENDSATTPAQILPDDRTGSSGSLPPGERIRLKIMKSGEKAGLSDAAKLKTCSKNMLHEKNQACRRGSLVTASS